MAIDTLLKELVLNVYGATGAIVLETDGEAVQWYAPGGVERLRLRAAYVAVVLRACRTTNNRAMLGDTRHLIIKYDGSSFIALELNQDCFLILEMTASANVGQALHRLDSAAAELRVQITA